MFSNLIYKVPKHDSKLGCCLMNVTCDMFLVRFIILVQQLNANLLQGWATALFKLLCELNVIALDRKSVV